MLYRATLFLFVGLLFLQIGCGSGSQTTSSTANPAASTPASSNPPAGSSQPPTPPAPTPTPSPSPSPRASDSYLATISPGPPGKNPSGIGQVTIDTTANNGAGTLQLIRSFQNAELQFCPGGVNSPCMNVAPVNTDANGNPALNFMFPEKGAFSGDWQIVTASCTTSCQLAASSTGDSGVNFKAAELPAGSISGGIGQTTGNAPGSGTVTLTNTTAHLVLSGTTANHNFNVSLCPTPQASNCMALSSVTTDAQGNASADVGSIQPFGWSVFEVTDSAGVESISAFRVQ